MRCVGIFVCFLHYSVEIYSAVVISLPGLSIIIIIYLTIFYRNLYMITTSIPLLPFPFPPSIPCKPNSQIHDIFFGYYCHTYMCMSTYICTYVHICIYGLLSIYMCPGLAILYCQHRQEIVPGGECFFLS